MIVKFVVPEFIDTENRFAKGIRGRVIVCPNPGDDFVLGKNYLVLGVWSSIESSMLPGMTYFDLRADREGSMNMTYPAPLFEIVERNIPSSFRLYNTSRSPKENTWGIEHHELQENKELSRGIIEYEPWAINRLDEIEREIIKEMGYEKYFPEKL